MKKIAQKTNRREFIASIGLAAALPFIAKPQPMTVDHRKAMFQKLFDLYHKSNALERANIRKELSELPLSPRGKETMREAVAALVEVCGI
jgi:hypothetical protein